MIDNSEHHKLEKNVLLYAIWNTERWWLHVAKELESDFNVTVITEHRAKNTRSLTSLFYKRFFKQRLFKSGFSEEDISDIRHRCRVLRNLPMNLATRMIKAWECVFEELIRAEKIAIVIGFPIDRYTMDICARIAERHSLDYLEITAGIAADTSMVMRRGIPLQIPTDMRIRREDWINELLEGDFKPRYIEYKNRYTKGLWLQTYIRQIMRSHAFKIIMLLKLDPLGLHFIDSQMWLAHKVKLSDIRFLRKNIVLNPEGFDKYENDKSKSVFVALQVFPEASIDYWIKDKDIIDYENTVLFFIKGCVENGMTVFVKDHPLQFGFRTFSLIEKIKNLGPKVIFLDYGIPSQSVFNRVSTVFTTTGTVGLEGRLRGLRSVVYKNYYSRFSEDFHEYYDLADLEKSISDLSRVDFGITNQANILLEKITFKGSIMDFHEKKDFNKNRIIQLISNIKIILKNEFENFNYNSSL